MPKAVISNRIFLEYDQPLLDKIKEELTYYIPSRNPAQPLPDIIQTYNRVSPKVASIPAGRLDLIPEDYQIIDNRILNPIVWPDSNVVLRDSQQYVYDSVDDNCIINAPVSWGKTFTALSIGKKLGQKTLVVVHTGALRMQWAEEAHKIYGVSPSVMGDGKRDWSKWLTIATVQTLVKYVDQMTEEFGCIIFDECHHIPANTFKTILDKVKARYKIGLSGTLERKDGKHVVFNDYFGFTRYKPKAENYMHPEVLRVKTDILFGNAADFNAKNYAAMLSLLANNPNYVDCVTRTALEMAAVGHIVLVVSERVDLLTNVHNLIGDDISCIVTGVTKAKDRIKAFEQVMNREKKILNGSMNIFSEGISINSVSCLILACQINNEPLLTQLIGRATRLFPNKLTPLIVDISLRGKGVQQGGRNRLLHYANCGYKIHTIERKYENF